MPEPTRKPSTTPGVNPKDNPNLGKVEGPPEEEFWEKYNNRLEFPLSTVATVLVHVLIGAILVFVLMKMANDGNKDGPAVKLVNLTGLDDIGDGSSGSGGIEDPFVKADGDPVTAAIASLPDPTKLPQIKEDLKQTIKYLDNVGNLPISDANAAAYESLEKSVRDKLLGARQGSGKEAGTGFDNSKGKGPGGTGTDSTLGRNMRWTLRFKVNSGRDYLDQLKAMNAKLLVPRPGSEKCLFIEDLNNPKASREATDADLRAMADQIKFSDNRRDAVRGVAATLELDFTPTSFWAFFPKGLEADLARKEMSYRNRRAEDIEETIFRVVIRGGEFDLVVDEQKVKR